jgi:hypothetical protein
MTQKITVVTTFSKEGYSVYGKRWIDSVIKNWPIDTRVVIYTDFDLEAPADNFVIKQFDAEFPYHPRFKELVIRAFNKDDKAIGIGHKTIKFSFKGFVICKELLTANGDYLVWLDGDAETINPVTKNTVRNIIEDNFLACQQEKNFQHVESGVLFFNTANILTAEFAKELEQYYFNKKFLKLKKPYDGYVIADILKNKKFIYRDLNSKFNFKDKKSKKEDTFLHPLLKSHFVHWIGTAKD